MLLRDDITVVVIELIKADRYSLTDYTREVQLQLINHMINCDDLVLLNKLLDKYDVPLFGLTLQERIAYYQLFVGNEE